MENRLIPFNRVQQLPFTVGRSVGLGFLAVLLTACADGRRSDAESGTFSRPGTSTTAMMTQMAMGNTFASDDPAVATGGSGSEPTLTFSARDQALAAGGSTTLSWSSTGTDRCEASGAWSGDKPVRGSATIGPLTEASTFTLTCSGAGGSVMSMLSVKIVGSVTLSWQAPAENVDGTPLTDLAGYEIYYGEQSRNYDDSVYVASGSATSKTIKLVSGSYYFAMTAWDVDGNESSYSNEVIKTVN